MISFYSVPTADNPNAATIMFRDSTYLAFSGFTVDRLATADDFAAYPDEYAAFLG